MTTVHFICTKTGRVWTRGSGKTEGHAILAAVGEHAQIANLSRRSWREVFTSTPTGNPVFEVVVGDLDAEVHEAERLRAEGTVWGFVEVTEYKPPLVLDQDDDEDEDEAA
ncbi:hypothetical protein [Rhizobium leguminosarum]|uniref:hypothetical protein n=1 Tax=Rhizobium leguminosarum TaxID=384 RepID=UPI003F9AF1F7